MNGIGMMLKSMGIDPEAMQAQMQAFGEGVKKFDEKMDLMLSKIEGLQGQLYVLDGKVEALYRALDDRFPMVDPLGPFATGGGFALPVMDDAAIAATRQVALTDGR